MATPTLVQSVATFSNEAEVGNAFKINLPNLSLASNCLIISMCWKYSAGRTITPSDDKGNTWVLVKQSDDATNLVSTGIFATYGAAAGTQVITVTFDATLTDFQAVLSEWYNIATSAAANGTINALAVAGPTVAAGSFTPGNNDANGGNLIYHHSQLWNANYGNALSAVTGFTPGASFSLLAAIRTGGSVVQTFVQATSAAINPTVTVAQVTSDAFNTVAAAFKAAAAGTAPSATGIRIVRVQHEQTPLGATTVNFPCIGNLLVLVTALSEGQCALSGFSDSKSNTWTRITTVDATGKPQFWRADNAATANNLTLSFTSTLNSVSIDLFDITGAAVAPFDLRTEASGTQSAISADITGAPQITPTTSNGLVIASINEFTGPPTNVMVGAGEVADHVFYTGQTDASTMDQGDGVGHKYNPDTTQIDFGWKQTAHAATTWNAVAAAFKAAAAAAAGPPSSRVFNPYLEDTPLVQQRKRSMAFLAPQPDRYVPRAQRPLIYADEWSAPVLNLHRIAYAGAQPSTYNPRPVPRLIYADDWFFVQLPRNYAAGYVGAPNVGTAAVYASWDGHARVVG